MERRRFNPPNRTIAASFPHQRMSPPGSGSRSDDGHCPVQVHRLSGGGQTERIFRVQEVHGSLDEIPFDEKGQFRSQMS